MDGVAIKVAIILAGAECSVLFGTKKNGAACGGLEGTMCLVFRCSLMKALQASCSAGLRG